MENFTIYNDPILARKRKGIAGDPHKQITETLTVNKNYVLLTEIPNRFNKVQVNGNYYEIEDGELSKNTYKVDYTNGIIYFHSSLNGQNLTFTYLGEGVLLFPDSRVYVSKKIQGWTLRDKLGDLDRLDVEQKNRVDNLIQSTPQPSEIVDIRTDRNGKVYTVSKERIDAEQKKIEDTYTDLNNKKYTSLKERLNYEQQILEQAYLTSDKNQLFDSLDKRLVYDYQKTHGEIARTNDELDTKIKQVNDSLGLKIGQVEQDLDESVEKIEQKINSIVLNVLSFKQIEDEEAHQYIQRALDKAYELGGGNVFVPAGNYKLKQTLVIKEKTKLTIHSNATLHKDHPDVLISNFTKTKGDVKLTGYNGHSNIILEGGILDCHGDTISTGQGIVIAHATNIVVKNMRIFDVAGGHAIEYNGVKDGVIDNVKAYGFKGEDFRGAFQIDLDKTGTPPTLGDYGSFDSTPCQNILVHNCYAGKSNKLSSWGRGVESHSSTIGRSHKNIKIINNTFEHTVRDGIRAYAWDDVFIHGNILKNCGSGITINTPIVNKIEDTIDINGNQTNASQTQINMIITNNIVDGTTLTDGLKHGISMWGQVSGYLTNAIVSGNIIKNTSLGSNGIYIKEASTLIVSENTIDSPGKNGISVENAKQSQISNNNINKAKITGIYVATNRDTDSTELQFSEYMQINSNTVVEAGGHGIHLVDARRSQVQGNMVINAGKSESNRFNGIYISSTSMNTTVRNNDIHTNDKRLIAGVFITGTNDSIHESNNFVPDTASYFNKPIVNELVI